MRVILFFIFLVGFSATIVAQETRYSYTTNSKRYLTNSRVDSIVRQVCTELFEERNMPTTLLTDHYRAIRNDLISLSENDILRAFKSIDNRLPKKIPVSNTLIIDSIRGLYEGNLRQQFRLAFIKYKTLAQYLSFTTSDRITFFNSTIRIKPDGKLLVEEKITVYNGNGLPHPKYGEEEVIKKAGGSNTEIQRGIVRAFPLYYVNKYKLFQNTTFDLKKVTRDGKRSEYHTENHENGILLYTGSSNIFLETGYYTYTITYETDHQIKLLKNFDELYYNVTGNGWSFRIDSAMCTVVLPKGAGVVSNRCYTGLQGKDEGRCKLVDINNRDSIALVFKTTRPLSPNEGFTVASSWSKGFVAGKGGWQQVGYYIWNNKAVFFLPIAALFSAIFCFIFWYRHGRDPAKGIIYPLFTPPAGYSPAALGYIYSQKFTRQLTAATIVDAAVRRKIKIDVEKDGLIFKHNVYTILKGDQKTIAPDTHYNDFDGEVKDLIGTTIKKGKYNEALGDLNKKVTSYCESNYKNKEGKSKKGYRGLFTLNGSYTTLPIIICIAAAGWGFFGGLIFSMMRLNFWQIAYYIGGIVLCVKVLQVFSRLLAVYSVDGRKLADQIEGFRMFLTTADENRFNTMTPPEKTLALYEKYLPFAIALGCDIEWGQQFEDIIKTASIESAVASSSFTHSFSKDSESFSSSFSSSFSGAISSASTPPSSSSGGGSSFGGGSSGGGGGGGGGGGW